MKIQFVKTQVFPQGMAPSDEKDALPLVELCGRTAYKSEDRITQDSAKSFVLMLKKHGHLSVLEHSNIVFKVEDNLQGGLGSKSPPLQEFLESLRKSLKDRSAYHRIYSLHEFSSGSFAVGGNFRAWIETLEFLKTESQRYFRFVGHHLNRFYPIIFESEKSLTDDFDYKVSLLSDREQLDLLKKDVRFDLPAFVFKLVCDRGITHEVVRHRVFSFTQESTRYVNYKSKGMTLILPEELIPFYDDETGAFTEEHPIVQEWLKRATTIFEWYQEDVARGLRPEIARDILPNLLKSEIFVTGRWSGWRHFIQLRDSQHAHPRIRFIAREVRKYFDSIGLTTE